MERAFETASDPIAVPSLDEKDAATLVKGAKPSVATATGSAFLPCGALRRRVAARKLIAEVRYFPQQKVAEIKPMSGCVVILAPLEGRVELEADGQLTTFARGDWAFVGRAETSVTWHSETTALVLMVQRSALQAAASKRLTGPRKLGSVRQNLGHAHALQSHLRAIVAAISMEPPLPAEIIGGLERDVVNAVIESLLAGQDGGQAFPVSHSISRAMQYVKEHLGEPCTADSLARVSGVTARTIRERFRDYLGMTVVDFVRRARLEWARERLGSGRESRTIRELSKHLGFQDAPAFSRAYTRGFGESPTQTRVRAVRSMH